MRVERIIKCRICGNKNIKTVVDLGNQVLSGRFPKIGEPDPPTAPLELVQCIGRDCCGLVQLSCDIPLAEMYGDGYGYLSGLNQTMKAHLESIVETAQSFVHLEKGDVVIDIGSNDATLLKAYSMFNINKVGFDAKHYERYYERLDLVFVPEFFREYSVKAKIITSIAMFYDLPDPNQFVRDIKSTLHEDGIWVFEQSYLPMMIEKNAFDTICHEHLEYYCLKQIKYLLDKNDLKIFDVRLTDTNGGSIMVFSCHMDSPRSFNKTVSKIIEGEHRHGYDIGKPFLPFMDRVDDIKERLVSFLKKGKESGKTIHLYGASTKVNVLLQYMGIDYRLVSFAAERNPSKYGCWTPGTHIPIFSEGFSRNLHPDYYLVGPWHFREGIIEREKEYLQGGGQMIFSLPSPEIVSMENGEISVRQI